MSVRLSTFVICVLAASACAPDEQATAGATSAHAPAHDGRYALVILAHQDGEAGVSVSAQFLHYRGVSRAAALHALVQPEEAWLIEGSPVAGACRSVSAQPARLEERAEASIDLLSAGALTVLAPSGAGRLALGPRNFPRVAFAMSGVVYDADAPQALPYSPRGLYRVVAEGEETRPARGTVSAAGAVTLTGHDFDESGLTVRWLGAGPLILTLSRDTGSRSAGIQCTTGPAERFQVPASALRAFGAGEAQLTLARVTYAPLHIAGVDGADLVFLSRDTTDLRVPGTGASLGEL